MKKLLIILLFPVCMQAQTRLYLTQLVPAISAPTPNAGWNVTSGSTLGLANTYVDNAGVITLTSGAVGAVAPRKALMAQYITAPLIAQTINGTVTGQLRIAMSSVTSRTGEGWVYVRVLNSNGTVATDVGTMTTTALTTTATNRTLIALTLSSVSITAGQRLCFEFGWNYSTGSATTTTGNMQVRSGRTGGDLPVDNTSTANSNPWIEFSQQLYFQTQLNVW